MANIRRTITHIQHTNEEGGKPVAEPTLLVAAAAIIKNPWFGRGYVEDLTPEIHTIAPVVEETLTDMVLAVTGDAIEGYGKASVVGLGGELEHAMAMTHTLWFGNQFRDAVAAKTYLAFSNIRGSAGNSVVPLMDKHDAGRRSHYQTIHCPFPMPLLTMKLLSHWVGPVGGHPHHRIGDRYKDLKDMGHDLDNPAGSLIIQPMTGQGLKAQKRLS